MKLISYRDKTYQYIREKYLRRQGGAPGQAIFGTKFPNVAGENNAIV